MLKRLADFSVDRPIATGMLLVSLLVLGIVAVFKLPLDVMPAFDEPEVDIEVPFPGSQPLESLRDIVRPIEEEVAAIAGVTGIQSRAESGSAQVEVQFSWADDMDIKKMEVREAVERARPRLPPDIGSIRIEADRNGPGGGALIEGRISAERDLSESWDLLDRRIRRPLERIPGVARVSLYGVEQQQLRVDLDLAALKSHGLQPNAVRTAIDAANLDLDVGVLRGDAVRFELRSLGRFQSAGAVADLPLGASGLRVRDVARVALEEPTLDYGRHLDRRFAIGIDAFKEPTANTVETVTLLLARIEEIKQDPELSGITLLVWENAAEQILNSLHGLRDAGVMGGLLAVFVLHFFLRRAQTTLVVAVAIPFSLLATCGAMYALGSQLDVLTMLGLMLGVGMLVDNGVVVIENIHRKQQQGLSPREAARQGTAEVALAVIASTATTIIVWSWLFVLPRSEMTIMMGQVALTICLAVACSLVVSLTFIPMASARLLPQTKLAPGIVQRRIVPAYRRMLAWTLRHRVIALASLLGLALTALIPFSLIEKSGEPRVQNRQVTIRYLVHDPATKDELEKHVNVVEAWLATIQDELAYETTYSWYSETQGCMTRVYMPAKSATMDELARVREVLKAQLPVIPGVTLVVADQQWWRQRDRGDRVVQVALHGDDPAYLQELAYEVLTRVAPLDDIEDLLGPDTIGSREARLNVDPERARALDLAPRTVAETVGFAFRGSRLKRMQRDDGEVEIAMGLPEDVRPGLDALTDLPIPRADGTTVPVGSVAELSVGRTPPSIQRSDRLTSLWVGVKFKRDKVTTEQAQELVKGALKGLPLPAGYSWDFGRWGRDRDEALGAMTAGLGLSLLVVILLMAALFESLMQPLAIIITLPLAFFGAFWALWIFGQDFEVVGFTGLVILIGIVVNNGIVLVDRVNALRAEGMSREEALLQGCGDRLRPVLMTAITTLVGLVPLAFASTVVANVYIDSLAVIVMGGLSTSTIFTLLALPAWYTAVEDLGAALLALLPRRIRPAASEGAASG